MTYYYGMLTSCREAALKYFALLVFGSPQAPVTGAAGTGGSGKVLPGGLAGALQFRVQVCVCLGCELLHTGGCFLLTTHPSAHYSHANFIFPSGH